MARLIFLAIGAAALGLSACQPARTSAGVSAGDLCVPFAATPATTGASATPATAPPIAPSDPAAATDDCLHRWAYALARSSDDASHVAEAALSACSPALARWNQQGSAAGGPGGGPIEAPSLITGQPTSPIAEHLTYAQGRALFYVVQARAGKCAAPPMTNGVPAGLARE